MENAKWRLIIIHQGTTIVSWKIGRQSWDDNFLTAQIFWPDFSLQKWKMSGNVWGSSTYVCAGATTIPRVSWSYHVWTKLFFYEFCPCTSFPITTTHPWAMERYIYFFSITRITQTLITHAHSLQCTHVCKPYPYEYLRRLIRQILEIDKVTTDTSLLMGTSPTTFSQGVEPGPKVLLRLLL